MSPEDHAIDGGESEGDENESCDSGKFQPLSEEQLSALGTYHSGLAEVCLQEWAVLLRCNGDQLVPLDELVSTLFDWFRTPLSVGEIATFLDRLVERGFLLRGEGGREFQTSALGAAVLTQTQDPLIRGTMWVLTKNKNEGDRHVEL